MSSENPSSRDRLEELLALAAVEGLCLPQREELDALLAEFPDALPEMFDNAIAALDLRFAMLDPHASSQGFLPPNLMEALARQGEAIVSGAQTTGSPGTPAKSAKVTASAAAVSAKSAPRPDGVPTVSPAESAHKPEGTSIRVSLAALAACMLLAFFLGWLMWNGSDTPGVQNGQNIVAQYQALEKQPGTLRIDWAAPEGQPDVSGKVIWNPQAQEGYMLFQGLAANDPTAQQYQLWIFDATRKAEHPVDGGVFNISPAQLDPGSGMNIVRITPKIKVDDATLFAVTVERPGGVVVSEREKIVAIAPVPEAQVP